MNSIFRISLAAAALATLTSCGGSSKGSGTLSLALKLSAPSTELFDVQSGGMHTLDTVGDHMSFTPTGFRLPIMKISISGDNGSNEQILYKCANTEEADCLVDLADQTKLDAITNAAKTATVDGGTYTMASLYTCKDGKGGSDKTNAYVTGSTSFNDGTHGVQVWATSSTAASGVTHPGTTATEATITNWGCATKVVKLNPGLVIADKGTATLSIMVDNSFGASVSAITSGGRGGCRIDPALNSGDGVCAEYPALLPYVGDETLTDKRFSLAHSVTSQADADANVAKANALIFVAMAGTKPVMASGRILYTATSALLAGNTAANDAVYGGPNYITETDFSTFTVNADGTIAFQQGGSGDTYAAKFSAFSLTNAGGTVTTRDGSATYFYHATPLN